MAVKTAQGGCRKTYKRVEIKILKISYTAAHFDFQINGHRKNFD